MLMQCGENRETNEKRPKGRRPEGFGAGLTLPSCQKKWLVLEHQYIS